MCAYIHAYIMCRNVRKCVSTKKIERKRKKVQRSAPHTKAKKMFFDFLVLPSRWVTLVVESFFANLRKCWAAAPPTPCGKKKSTGAREGHDEEKFGRKKVNPLFKREREGGVTK